VEKVLTTVVILIRRVTCAIFLLLFRCADYPDYFLKDTYLKYVGWSLNDKHAGVRGAALAALAALYAQEDNIAPMDTFSARFADRILQMADDVDDGVVAKALTVLAALLQAELMELDQARTLTSSPHHLSLPVGCEESHERPSLSTEDCCV
jgi:hypothetical protein